MRNFDANTHQSMHDVIYCHKFIVVKRRIEVGSRGHHKILVIKRRIAGIQQRLLYA